jgi:hypothetical protein
MYFRYFPKTLYSFELNSQNALSVTNIFARFKFNSQVLNNAYAMYKYQIVSGDTPEIVAYKQYGDPTYHWVICLTNNLLDPVFDLPLSQDELERKIVKKYGYANIANAYSTIHHYNLDVVKLLSEVGGATTKTEENYTVTLDQYNYNSNTIVTKPINTTTTETISFRANNSDPSTAITSTLTIQSTYKPVYVYDYEIELNESNRQIKILKPQYIPSLINEIGQVLNA